MIEVKMLITGLDSEDADQLEIVAAQISRALQESVKYKLRNLWISSKKGCEIAVNINTVDEEGKVEEKTDGN